MSKILIVYFSHNKENYFSGNIVNLEKGNVQVIAEALSTMIDADIYQIKEVDAYPFDYHECTLRASDELKNNARPQILDPLESIDEYDTIYLGYPNWWSTMPTIVMTFLESYDFTINISILFVHMKEVVWVEVKVILKNFVQTVSFIKD